MALGELHPRRLNDKKCREIRQANSQNHLAGARLTESVSWIACPGGDTSLSSQIVTRAMNFSGSYSDATAAQQS
jgi:hypothetical protein